MNSVEELSHTAISFAFHVILLSSKKSNSYMEDSGIISIASMIENYFSCPFTIEMVDESNLIYLENKPSIELQSLPYITWPRYAASHVFFSSTLDYFIANSYFNDWII